MNIFSSNFSLCSCDSWNSTCSYLSLSAFLHFMFSLDNFICAHSLIQRPDFHLRAADAVFRFTRDHRLPEGCKEFHTTYWLNNRLPEFIKKKTTTTTRYLISNCKVLAFRLNQQAQKNPLLTLRVSSRVKGWWCSAARCPPLSCVRWEKAANGTEIVVPLQRGENSKWP